MFRALLGIASVVAAGPWAAAPCAAQQQTGIPSLVFSAEFLSVARRQTDDGALLKPNDQDGRLPNPLGSSDVTAFSGGELDGGRRNAFRGELQLTALQQRLVFSGMGAWGLKGQATKTRLNATFAQDAAYEIADADVDTANADNIYAMSARRSAMFWGADGSLAVPLVSPAGSRIEALVGLRYMQFKDKLHAIVYDDLDDFAGADNDVDRVSVLTRNRLAGPQLGLRGTIPLAGGLSLGGTMKLGYLHADTTVATTFASDNNPANVLNKSYSGQAWATVFELSPQLTFALGEGIEVFGGGFLLHVKGLGEADRQFGRVSDADFRSIERSGDTMLYGVTVGARIKLD